MPAETIVVFLAVCVAGLPAHPAARSLAGVTPRTRDRPHLALVWVVAVATRRRIARSRREALPLVLELLARELRSGVTMTQAFENVASTADVTLDLDVVVARLHDGELVGPAIDWWVSRFDPGDAALVAGVFHLGAETGTAIADALDRAVSGIRARTELADEIGSLTAQSRASAMLVALAPVGFGGVLIVAEPTAVTFLFTSGLGVVCLGAGLTLDAIGFWWMYRLVARVAS